MGRPWITDVAECAGVSAKTRANVLGDYGHVFERTRAAVRGPSTPSATGATSPDGSRAGAVRA